MSNTSVATPSSSSDIHSNTEAKSLLRQHWGYDQFRPHQAEIVAALSSGRDVFALMPTGAGKSLCYQLPALMQSGTTVVISPLIALMKDQVDAAVSNGIRAGCLHSGLSTDDRREVMQAYRAGALDLLYLAPERLALDGFLDQLRRCPAGRPHAFAIDEAHCISEWGHDFRADYLSLGRLREAFPEAPLAAFTATATERVAADIVERLSLRDPFRIRASFNRPNLHYAVLPKHDAEGQIIGFIRSRPGEAGIVYRSTRRNVEETALALRASGINARPYHAGMDNDQRSTHQEQFIRGEVDVIVATIAFGMGIDKPDVRFVIHGDLPKNIEGYYQETGRAGRDGDPSNCLLLYGAGDASLHLHFMQEIEDENERAAAHARLRSIEQYARGHDCRRRVLLQYFGESICETDCEGCDICDSDLEEIDATRDARMLLSAVARTGERFGMVHVCDIVAGAATARIRQFGHDQLSTYGVGRDSPKSHWREIGEALLARGVLRSEDGRMPVIKFGEGAREILTGQQPFVLRRLPQAQRVPARSASSRDVEVAHPELFEQLRIVRRELAARESVPPYVVASDRMLRDLCARLPAGRAQLTEVHGFGSHKIEQYGDPFLQVVRQFREENPGTAPVPHLGEGSAAKRTNRTEGTREGRVARAEVTLVRLREGWDLARIAEEQGVQERTVIDRIDRLAIRGEAPPVEHLLSDDARKTLEPLFRRMGLQRLKPVVEAAAAKGFPSDYEQAKLVRAWLSGRDNTPPEKPEYLATRGTRIT